MTTAFVSDLHLDARRPEVTTLFREFLANEARTLDGLYILGDLFEAWIGDDDPDPHNGVVRQDLAALTAAGVPAWFMHGNRDFLVGDAFSRETGVQLLDDPIVVDLYGTSTLLTHGDALCTDDVDYQTFRATVRNPAWQQAFLSQPVDARRRLAAQARAESQRQQSGKSMDIMDVNQGEVVKMMRDHGVTRMIHGHTHRPDTHQFAVDGVQYTRIVLGDWYEQGSILRCDESGCELQQLPLP
ncbi:MAG TPA: UDP-2,3-diacylglucosamine diphosphatase [Gammaproteobacteria bacterium]|nr:UDP-2,3-diacylglucosamine diphosphatase [Gammaproteobacteria bacterium]